MPLDLLQQGFRILYLRPKTTTNAKKDIFESRRAQYCTTTDKCSRRIILEGSYGLVCIVTFIATIERDD